MDTKNDYLTSIADVYKILEIKKYKLISEHDSLANNSAVRSIIDKGIKEINIDLTTAKTAEDLSVYSEFLSSLVTSELSDDDQGYVLDDEIELLERAKALPLEELRAINIVLKNSDNSANRILNMLNIPSKLFLNRLRSCMHAQIIEAKYHNYIFISSMFRVKSKDIILLSVLASHDNNKSAFVGGNYIFNSGNKRYNFPVRLFLEALYKYGKVFTMQGKNAKLFLDGFIPNAEIPNNEDVLTSGKSNILSYPVDGGIEFEFAFYDSYLFREEDISKGIYI